MFRALVSAIVLALSLGLAACESAREHGNMIQTGPSADKPDLTGYSQGEMGWTDQSENTGKTASERP